LAGEVEVEPLNSPAMHVGFYRAWHGNPARDHETLIRMGPEAEIVTGEWIKLEVGLEFITSREMTLIFEPFLTDETETPRWPLGKKVYRAASGEFLATATVELVPFGQQVLVAVGNLADDSMPVSLDDYLGIREQGNRVCIPPGRTYRTGFRLYVDDRLIEDRILYYDWLKGVPQTIRVIR
ncbi:MAG: hypothetical protein U9P14_02340, partial [Gemmatimonadota bacterium]|nr:hypothetical protein [Gemmatimonadota bacterium]